jgi:transcriptional regulator
LISHHEAGMEASHLPLLVEWKDDAPAGLVGHMARANPQWREAAGRVVLAIFQGPHAYVSPRWYAEPNTVPTWNYLAVHAYGLFQLLDESQTRELLERSVTEFEAGLDNPWNMQENDAEFLDKLVSQIVGFRIEITRLEGKWKLNQNHSRERRQRVIEQLRRQSSPNSQDIAAEMEQSLSPGESD